MRVFCEEGGCKAETSVKGGARAKKVENHCDSK